MNNIMAKITSHKKHTPCLETSQIMWQRWFEAVISHPLFLTLYWCSDCPDDRQNIFGNCFVKVKWNLLVVRGYTMDFSQKGTNYLWPEWHFYDDSCIILAILCLK